MATFNLQIDNPYKMPNMDVAHTTPNGASVAPYPAAVMTAPVISNSPVPYGPVQPTVGSVMGTTTKAQPAPVIQPAAAMPSNAQTLESIRQQALAIQSQIPTATGGTRAFSSPTPLADPEKPWAPMTSQQEREIQRNQMRLFQSEIDATNQIYDQMVSQARLQGEGRLGSRAAMGARAGLLGSDFQDAAVSNQEAENRGIISGIQSERLAKISAIMGKGRQSAVDEIAAKNKANREGAEAKIKFMSEKQDRRAKNLAQLAKSLVDQDIDPSELSEKELSEIAKSYGTTVNDIKDSYNSIKVSSDAESAKTALSTRKTEAEIKKIENDIASGKLLKIGEGDMLYNTETGETFKNPKTKTPGSGSSDSSVELSAANKKTLLGGGWTQADIATLESDVAQYGLTEVIANAKANGATASQIKALEKSYSAEEGSGQQFLSKDYFANLFTSSQLEKAAADAGFGDLGEGLFNLKDVDTEGYLNYLEKAIESYRAAGYTDQEILKMMQ
jgi:DNA-binding transcriptional regulator YhcF (GntR family)